MEAGESLNTYGKRLHSARKASGLNQTQLAGKVGIDQSQVSDLENDKYEGSAYTAQLAHHTGVQALWLATGEGPRHSTNKDDLTAFLSLLNELDELFRQERVRAKPGGLGKVAMTAYRIQLAEGKRPTRASLLELVRSRAA